MLKKLLKLLSDGKYHSGEEIANQFSVSRTAIWKNIEKIRSKGIEVESYPKKGYKILDPIELLEKKKVLSNINSEIKSIAPNFNLEVLDSVGSTNTYLQEKHNLKSASLVTSEEQTAGKGRNGRKWSSPFGKNIYLSTYWQFSDNMPFFSVLSLYFGVTVAQALNNYINEKLLLDKNNIHIKVKWPNDLYYKDKKIAGILIDSNREAEGPINAIIGLGVNIKKAKSVKSIEDIIHNFDSSIDISRNEVLSCIINAVISSLNNFNNYDHKKFNKDWQKLDFLYGKKVKVITSDQKSYEGVMQGIDEFGGILIHNNNAISKIYSAMKVDYNL